MFLLQISNRLIAVLRTVDYVKAIQPRYSPMAPLQLEAPSSQQHSELV